MATALQCPQLLLHCAASNGVRENNSKVIGTSQRQQQASSTMKDSNISVNVWLAWGPRRIRW